MGAVPEGDTLYKLGFTGFTNLNAVWSRGWLMITTLLVFTIPVSNYITPTTDTLDDGKDEKSFKTIANWGIIIH